MIRKKRSPFRRHILGVKKDPILTCPNEPQCPHPGVIHDIYEPGDPYPTCCIEGCTCGHPGSATVTRDADGTSTVQRADPVIQVSAGLLDTLGIGIDDDLVLDTAGEYVYRYLRPDPKDGRVLIYGRFHGREEEPGAADASGVDHR